MSSPAQSVSNDAVPGLSASVTGEVMVASIIIIFFIFILVLILYFRANRYMGAIPDVPGASVSFIFSSGGRSADAAARPRPGLNPAILKSLPVTVFRSADFNDSIECAVCLTELADDDLARMLPACRHGFHLDCIDMWFASHSTCPICRSSVELSKLPAAYSEQMSLNIPHPSVNRGGLPPRPDRGEGCSSSSSYGSRKPSRVLVIDIPRVGMENSTLPSNRSSPAAELKTPSPTMARLRSLRRMLSGGSRGLSPAPSPRERDIEQGALPPSPAPAASDGSVGETSSSSRNAREFEESNVGS
ncbi:RING-H2 finger protein ATL2 [Apostasia shenzhenica]|uniref:RING-H2 finger protein ATL2 n=1 Tax=Apostasia shenzhenica TaxID=1088818 RepID=A0A2I0B8A0_9ASPA|nr:RING-H2 finger protein ATL2 [Apostasia shenzhenica]